MKKEELCNSRSKSKCRCDLSAIPWKCVFIAKVDMGRFIGPCQIEVQLIEGERPFQE